MNVDLGSTKEIKWVDGQNNYDLDKLVLDGVTIWQKMFEVTGTATYDPITRIVTYQISGDIATLTSWSYEAIRQDSYANYLSVNGDLQSYYDDSNNTWDYDQNGVAEPVQSKTAEEFAKSHWDLSGRGEDRAGMITSGVVVNDITSGPPEVNGTIVLSNVLDETDDGTWDVAFKGYEGDTLRGETTTTAIVATPFVEITSVVELTPSAPETPIAVGDIVGMGVWGVEVEPYDQDSDRDFFRNVVLDGIFDSVNWPADGNNGERQGRVSKTFQGLIDDYGVWTPGSTGNEGSGYSGTPKSTLTSIINNIPTASTAYAWQMFDMSDSPNWETQVREFADHSAAVGFQFTATIGETTYTLGVTKASVYWGVQNYQAMPYIRPAQYANSFWQENAIRIGAPIDNYDIYEIEVIS